jgi:dipeptidyl aminopeptidase/acylaminoacyl peptidase
MTRRILATGAIVGLIAVGPIKSQPSSSIVTQAPCQFTTFEAQSAYTKRVYTEHEFEKAKTSVTIECSKVTYLSDGLRVVGFIVRPLAGGNRYPVIVYNRGGLLHIGKIDTPHILDFYDLAAHGFVVVASQYRGNDGGEGREEFGGADVNDVINLRNLAASLPYADPRNIFFFGVSRGGMMTFLALRRGAVANAAVVLGAVLDVEDAAQFTKQRAPGIAKAIEKLIPDYGPAALRERSVTEWPGQVNVPILIIHGGADEEVPTLQALAFATKLDNLRKPYELVVYANDTHEVTNNRQDRNSRIIAWFKRHLR